MNRGVQDDFATEGGEVEKRDDKWCERYPEELHPAAKIDQYSFAFRALLFLREQGLHSRNTYARFFPCLALLPGASFRINRMRMKSRQWAERTKKLLHSAAAVSTMHPGRVPCKCNIHGFPRRWNVRNVRFSFLSCYEYSTASHGSTSEKFFLKRFYLLWKISYYFWDSLFRRRTKNPFGKRRRPGNRAKRI